MVLFAKLSGYGSLTIFMLKSYFDYRTGMSAFTLHHNTPVWTWFSLMPFRKQNLTCVLDDILYNKKVVCVICWGCSECKTGGHNCRVPDVVSV